MPRSRRLCAEERTVLQAQLTRKLNAPPTSSMGRLFDAVSALLGIRQAATYEGQAAIELEALADPLEPGSYPFEIRGEEIDPAPVLRAILKDWQAGMPVPRLSARFHNSIAQLCFDVCEQIRRETGLAVVALSGGVWQNRYLYERTIQGLASRGFEVLVHRQLPTNDGCISLGQAIVAAQIRR